MGRITRNRTPPNSAQFPTAMRDGTQRLGTVTYQHWSGLMYGQDYVLNMGASAKVAPVATITPTGIHSVVRSGWAFDRERWAHSWMDGRRHSPGNTRSNHWNTTWGDDTSPPMWLRLTPDDSDRIYDLDASDIRYGTRNYESYNNFRQCIEWNGERCSDYAGWYWQVRWRAHRDQRRQITLNDLGLGNVTLPDQPYFR